MREDEARYREQEEGNGLLGRLFGICTWSWPRKGHEKHGGCHMLPS